jgi:hypothetical protein
MLGPHSDRCAIVAVESLFFGMRRDPLVPPVVRQTLVSSLAHRIAAMVWYAYAVSSIDIGWEHLPLAEEVTADIARQEAAEVVHEYPGAYGVLESLSAIKEAKAEARKVGWEGDYRDAPCVFWLPSRTRAT